MQQLPQVIFLFLKKETPRPTNGQNLQFPRRVPSPKLNEVQSWVQLQ